MKILVDAMGGDNAPAAIIEGVVAALNKNSEIELVLCGRQNEVEAELKKYTYDKSRVEIVDCPDVIDMNDIPTEAVRRKGTSMMTAYWMLKKQEELDAFVTAGSTGAAIAGGQLILGRIKGVKRPALCCMIPNVSGEEGKKTLLCDCGANAECKPIMLCQFAVLASAYASVAFGIKHPKVGLLNNGTEEHKGDPLHQETYKLLSSIDCINFIGNVEGRDTLIGDVDVVVCDGFSGNIAVKSIEGTAKMMLKVMKKQFTSSLSSKIGSLFLLGAIKRMRTELDFEKIGGAILLGLKKPVIKSHGSSKASAIEAAINDAYMAVKSNLVANVAGNLEKIDLDNLVKSEEE
ncbi:MAG: phosphate acyltransferase PlsX [Clostridiales bacterium]|nr:phosphate acyltransferase PlsX [Clostridiales bacterium]